MWVSGCKLSQWGLCLMHNTEYYQWNGPLEPTLQRFYFPWRELSLAATRNKTCLVPNYRFYEHPVQTFLSVSSTSCRQLTPPNLPSLSRTQTPQGLERSVWLCPSPASCVGFVRFSSTELLAVQQQLDPPLGNQTDTQVKVSHWARLWGGGETGWFEMNPHVWISFGHLKVAAPLTCTYIHHFYLFTCINDIKLKFL